MALNQKEAYRLKRTHPAYGPLVEQWSWARALRDGLLASPGARRRWLVKGAREGESEFAQRSELTTHAPLVPMIVGRICGAVWKKEPQRTYPGADVRGSSPLRDFVSAATRDGQDLAELARDAAAGALWGRYSLVLLDRRRLPEGADPVTRADDHALGLDRPYATLYEPEQVLDWSTGEDGLLEYVKLVSPPRTQDGRRVTEYREVSGEGIRVWRLIENPDGSFHDLESAPPVPLAETLRAARRLPVAVCQYDAIDGLQGRSPLSGALQAELRCFRLLSDVLWDLYLAGHPHLVTWTERMLGEIAPNTSVYTKLKPGGHDEPAEEMKWVEAQLPGLDHQFEALREARAEIFRQAGISPLGQISNPDRAATASGVSLAWQFETSEAQVLSGVAAMAEDFEWDILSLAALDVGAIDGPAEAARRIAVSYSKDFSLKSPERMLALVRDAAELYGRDSVVARTLLKRTRSALLEGLPGGELAASDREIDAIGGARPETAGA